MSNKKIYVPKINANEFYSVASDYANPEELFREAISNSYDANADSLYINCYMKENRTLIIEITDNGEGMTETMITENFWDLGNSSSKLLNNKIGEKGHGTKIYLNSTKVEVWSKRDNKIYYAYTENPLENLSNNIQHKIKYMHVEQCQELSDFKHGTHIRITNYDNSSNRFKYQKDNLTDYINWFTKHGSFENEFIEEKINKNLYLKGIDSTDYTILPFGHIFAKENSDTTKLLDEYDQDAIKYFSKKFKKQSTLKEYGFADIKYEIIINVEGEHAKKSYNPCLKDKKTKYGGYKSSDRYGLYICKDYIPIERKNEWIPSFQNGSNAIQMIHGFINCQHLSLTANRGAITIDKDGVVEALEKASAKFISEINKQLIDLDTLRKYKKEKEIINKEVTELKKRIKIIQSKKRYHFKIENHEYTILEPQNEQETYSVFLTLYTLRKDLFPFTPMDYNTYQGIDIIASPLNTELQLPNYFYVEMKHIFTNNSFNHIFKNICYIVCWDVHTSIIDKVQIKSKIEEEKTFTIHYVEDRIYIDEPSMHNKVEIICLDKIINKLND